MRLNFALIQHHKWNGEFINSLYPWEREMYVDQLDAFLEKEKAGNQQTM